MMHSPTLSGWPGVLEHYRPYLDWLPESAKIVTLQEGNTPLIPAPRLAAEAGGGFDLFLKYEAINPTASFKDRGMTAAMTQAVVRGAKLVVCASTGNTSASAAAYAGRAGLRCAVLLPHGKIALGKLAQARMYGAEMIALRGSFDDALRLVRELSTQPGVEIVNSINPVRIEGQKTAAFEVCARPISIFCPSATPGTSPLTGAAFANTKSTARFPRFRACAGSKPPAPRRSSRAGSSPIPRLSPPLSASAIPRAGKAPTRPSPNRRG
jgi:threonine synthase